MKKISILFLAFATIITCASAQNKPSSPLAIATGKIGAANVKIVYSQPSAKGRKIMGELVPYNKEVWRTGANAATTIQFDKPVKIEGKDVAAGKYALFTIPGETEWIIIISKNSDQMGAFGYTEKDDLLRVVVKPSKINEFVETFTIKVGNDEVLLTWENTAVAFKVKG